MKEPKLTPDQLHRLIDEVAELAYGEVVWSWQVAAACRKANCIDWWNDRGCNAYYEGDDCHAGLSAVLILLSEGG